MFRLITTFDEVPPSPRYDRHGTACTAPHRPHRGIGVDLKRVPPKSRPTASAPSPILRSNSRWKRPARTPPSTFLFLLIHLSNSPEPRGSRLFVTEEQSKLPSPTQRRGWSPYISEVLRTGASSRRAAARRVWWLYRRGPRALSTAFMAVFLPTHTVANSGIFLRRRGLVRRPAAL